MQKKVLSVVLATYNEEENIGACLESIKSIAKEIVIVDGSSADKTREISKVFGAKVFKVSNKLMFHKNKQLALEKAKGDWILQLDADERVTSSLREEIKNKTLCRRNAEHARLKTSAKIKNVDDINGYYIPRENYFLGKWLQKGGQYPDYVIRLVKNGKAYFPCETVHEQMKVDGEIAYLKHPLIHLANPDLKSYFRKANIYTSETALKLEKDKVKINILNIISYLIIRPFYTFLNLLIRHKGFIDGFYGFLFAFLSGLHYPIAFIKYWKKRKVN